MREMSSITSMLQALSVWIRNQCDRMSGVQMSGKGSFIPKKQVDLRCESSNFQGSTELKQLAQEKTNGAFDKDKCISTSSSGRQIERDAGEWWNDGCRHCFCEQRQEFCSLISCPSKPPECPQESWKHKDDGEIFISINLL